MAKVWIALASMFGFAAVALGAFGAHGLKGKLTPELFAAFTTGVQYHFYHTFALLVVAVLMLKWPAERWLSVSAVMFALGILLFSGSLYALALGGPRWLGPITPLGGLSFMVGWLTLMMAAWRIS